MDDCIHIAFGVVEENRETITDGHSEWNASIGYQTITFRTLEVLFRNRADAATVRLRKHHRKRSITVSECVPADFPVGVRCREVDRRCIVTPSLEHKPSITLRMAKRYRPALCHDSARGVFEVVDLMEQPLHRFELGKPLIESFKQ